METIQCIFCGDNCDQEVCYGCQDTAETMDLDINELIEVIQ